MPGVRIAVVFYSELGGVFFPFDQYNYDYGAMKADIASPRFAASAKELGGKQLYILAHNGVHAARIEVRGPAPALRVRLWLWLRLRRWRWLWRWRRCVWV